ncbi:MAG: L,D-transpeptidase family protein [Gammaproteobacteria bacterium]
MPPYVKSFFAVTLVFTFAGSVFAADESVAEALTLRLQALTETPDATIEGVPLLAGPLVADFYARRDLEPAWTRKRQIDEMLSIIEGVGDDGLDPDDFPLSQLRALRADAAAGSAFAAAGLDLLLTESLARYGYQLAFGKVDNRRLDPNINFRRELSDDEDPAVTIQQAIDSPSLREFLAAEFPFGPVYHRLREALVEHRDIADAGGWPSVPAGATLKPGETDSRVAPLRLRLAATGDLPAGAPTQGDLYDGDVEVGVRTFQRRHSLDVDGAVGPATLEALNIPVERRIDQIRLSLERLRWVQAEIADEVVIVNIAGFRAFLVRDRKIDWVTRVMVGKQYRQTPVFRGDIRYLEMNPTWTIPPGILRNDTLPAIKRDPNYLTDRNISVIDRDGRKVDPASVDWTQYTRGVPYTLRQEPGPNNALGTIKFIFPNEHFVFLHDTPSRYLFDRAERAFSSGCIRVEDPLKLAELLLDDSKKWDRAALQKKIDGGVTERVYLDEPVPVLIIYLTAAVGQDDRIRFVKDIYERDAKLLDALNEPVAVVLPGST